MAALLFVGTFTNGASFGEECSRERAIVAREICAKFFHFSRSDLARLCGLARHRH